MNASFNVWSNSSSSSPLTLKISLSKLIGWHPDALSHTAHSQASSLVGVSIHTIEHTLQAQQYLVLFLQGRLRLRSHTVPSLIHMVSFSKLLCCIIHVNAAQRNTLRAVGSDQTVRRPLPSHINLWRLECRMSYSLLGTCLST